MVTADVVHCSGEWRRQREGGGGLGIFRLGRTEQAYGLRGRSGDGGEVTGGEEEEGVELGLRWRCDLGGGS